MFFSLWTHEISIRKLKTILIIFFLRAENIVCALFYMYTYKLFPRRWNRNLTLSPLLTTAFCFVFYRIIARAEQRQSRKNTHKEWLATDMHDNLHCWRRGDVVGIRHGNFRFSSTGFRFNSTYGYTYIHNTRYSRLYIYT